MPATAAMIDPPVLALRMTFESDVTARLVVVAWVVVEFPVTTRFPLMVDEAVERMPPENVRRVEVEFPGKRYEKVGRPRDDVAVRVYPDDELPTSI